MSILPRPTSRPITRHLSHYFIVLALALTGLEWARFSQSVQAADEIRASFGPIQASIPLDSLETYVEAGTIDDELAPYIRYVDPTQLDELRTFLGSPISTDLDVVTMTHFLYSDPGEVLLSRVGDIIQTRQQNGQIALRAALILAAADEGGLTPLNVIDQFPTQSLVIDFETGWAIARDIQQVIRQSSNAIAQVKKEFQASLADSPPLPLHHQTTQIQPLRYDWDVATTTVQLERRVFPVDIYVPQRETPAPIVIISHGLGSNRDSYKYLAKHLVSYGFVVIVPEHQGSNAEHIQALLQGESEEVAESEEFINRAQDISLILDELETRATKDPQLFNALDFDNIGVIGQSFGGYTALALGGAILHFDHLSTHCPTPTEAATATNDARGDRSLNLSLILQCRALDLNHASSLTTEDFTANPQPTHLPAPQSDDASTGATATLSLHDQRIDAIIAINPIGSAIFGPAGFEAVDIPVMIMTGSADIVAPTLWEQLHPFNWMQAPDKFLLMMHNGTHFSTIGISDDDIPLPEPVLGPAPELARRYVQTISLSFFQSYLSTVESPGAVPSTTIPSESVLSETVPSSLNPRHRFAGIPLSPAYIDRLSRDRMPLSLIQSDIALQD